MPKQICGYVLPTEMVRLSFSATSIIIAVIALINMIFICVAGKEHCLKSAQTEESFSLPKEFVGKKGRVVISNYGVEGEMGDGFTAKPYETRVIE